MKNYNVKFKILDNKLTIQLRDKGKIINATNLTVGKDIDNMLIKALDKLLSGTKIERLSIKSAKIAGKLKDAALSSMVLRTVKNALIL